MTQDRDITLEDTIYISFTSRAFATGIPTVLAGTPVVSAYENAGTTGITAGITLGVDHDGVVGLNLLTIVATAANGFEDGKDYNLVITAGTVSGVSVVGETAAGFTIGRTTALKPTVPGRTLTLTLGGHASMNHADIDGQEASVDFENTTVGFVTAARVSGFLGTAISEATPGRIAGNFDTFYDNGDAQTTKTVDHVGGVITQLPQQFLAVSDNSAQDSGTFLDTQTIDTTYIARQGLSVSFLVNFAVGSGNSPFEVYTIINHEANGTRNGLWEMFNYTTVGFDTLRLVPNNGIDSVFAVRQFPSGDPTDYDDGAGNVQFRFTTDAHASSNMQVDFLKVTCITDAGDIPTAAEIAAITAATLGQLHGRGNWEGDYLRITEIESITSQTEFVLTGSVDGIPAGSFLFVYDGSAVSTSAQTSARYITSYQADTPSVGLSTVIIESAQAFTVTEDMRTQIRLNLPVNVDAIGLDRTAAANLKNQYDGTTGLVGDLFPSTQAQANSVASGSGGLKKSSSAVVITTGTETSGTVTDTESLNGVLHTITNAAGSTEFYYEFNVGVVGIATGVLWNGFVNAMNDSSQVFYFDWTSTTYKQIDTIAGQNGTDIIPQPFDVPVGATDSNGDVRIQFVSTDAVDVNTDRIWIQYTSVAAQAIVFASGTAQSGGDNTVQLAVGDVEKDDQYIGSSVLLITGTGARQEGIISDSVALTDTLTVSRKWPVDNPDNTTGYVVIPGQVHSATRNGGYDGIVYYSDTGDTGVLINVNGTTSNPVGDEANAYTIAADVAVNANIFNTKTGSTFALPSDSTNKQFVGSGWRLTLNDQTVTNMRVNGAVFITGIGNGSGVSYFSSAFGAVTLDDCSGSQVGFGAAGGVFTISSTGSYIFGNCGSVSTTAAAVINYASNAATVDLRDCSGHIEIQNAPAGAVCMIQSAGCKLTINANCSASMTVILAGVVNVNNAAGVTIDQSANAVDLIAAVPTLAEFITEDTGETTAADGSVAKIAQGAAGGNVTVGSMTTAALAQFATDDTGETVGADGSVAKISQGAGGGGGGDATLDNQEAILSKLTKPARIFVAQVTPSTLALIRGDAYDGTSWPTLTWNAGKDIEGIPATLTIRRKEDTKDDTPVLQVTGVGVGELVEVVLKSSDTINLPVSDTPWDLKFDVELVHAADSEQTPAFGQVTVFEDQT